MSEHAKTIASMLGVFLMVTVLATFCSCSKPSPGPSSGPDSKPISGPGFLSPDKKYKAVRTGSGDNVHYQIIQVGKGKVVLTTESQYVDTPNDVKAGAFSPDSREFAAAYHYGHDGGYTWIGIWNLETGARRETMDKKNERRTVIHNSDFEKKEDQK